MSKHKFKWFDGSELEFEDFILDVNARIYCVMPPMKARHNTWAYVFVSPKDYEDYRESRYNSRKAKPDEKIIRVGVLENSTSHGFVKGCYIPFKIVNYNPAVNCLDGLDGDFIMHPDYAIKTN